MTLPAQTSDRLCPHFGECGGCESQNVAYPDQVAAKKRYLENLFAAEWGKDVHVIPSPIVWHYRNKVDFNFGLRHYPEPPPKDFPRETLLGFTRPGAWYHPIDIETCLIAPEGVAALLDAVRAWYRREGLPAVGKRGEGFLRALLVREGKRTGERMVALFTSEGAWNPQGFLDAVRQSYLSHSIYRGTFSRSARGAFADRVELLEGAEHIHEEMIIRDGAAERRIRFRISPFSFFQTNTLAAEILYSEIRQWVRASNAQILYDLYGGAGGIAFSCSDLVQLVRSVESEPSATSDGEHNARTNKIDNVFFFTDQMRKYLHGLAETGGMEPNAVAVADPPRSGMTPKPVQRLIECAPQRLLYVSCKASVLKEELPAFLKAYTLERLWAVDMFPHTPHVEVLASLVRK